MVLQQQKILTVNYYLSIIISGCYLYLGIGAHHSQTCHRRGGFILVIFEVPLSIVGLLWMVLEMELICTITIWMGVGDSCYCNKIHLAV